MRLYLTITLLLVSFQASAWVLRADFEQGAVGQLANGNDGFSLPYTTTRFSSDRAISGSQSAISTVTQGDDGFGDWGGEWVLPTQLGEGDQLWYRVWVYFPTGFDFNCGCPEGIKFMRTRVYDSSDRFEGSQDYYLRADGAVMATGINSREFYEVNHPYPYTDIRGLAGPITTGTWHAYEHYIKFSATPGQGILRAWLDGKLIFEDRVTATLETPTSKAKQVTLWTYWNNKAPRTQSAYVDDVVITNEAPNNTDDQGNLFIGTGGATFAYPPNPPTVIP